MTVKPLRRRTLTLKQLQAKSLRLISKMRKHLSVPPHISGVTDGEFTENVLCPLETQIKEDVEMMKMLEASKSCVTACDFNGFWCPSVCPITLLPFFMWIEHPQFGWLPTYGGPFDSYTIPEPQIEDPKNRFDIEYTRYRYDHDEGGWLIDECEVVQERVVFEETLIELNAWPD